MIYEFPRRNSWAANSRLAAVYEVDQPGLESE